MFVLNIFPEGALDSSVITTVWIGVMLVAVFNLRFGWVLSGLVVPGYLVPLLIVRPTSAAVVIVEAIITYLIVIFLAGPLARLRGWGSFFGRDRFFALILISVIVRVVMDGAILPAFGAWLNDYYGLSFDYRNNLHSFGLIIIALIANQFWKTGIIKGMVPLSVIIGLTYLIIRFVLIEFTNFRVSGLSYMFEDITASILSSPKAYIILLTTAFVASRMNLVYGWDFNGILIPSLLALQWYEPSKILISFLEAFIILGIGKMLLQIPFIRDANVEGARKLLLFFSISFAWKIMLSYTLIAFAPELKVSDYFAFGYLLSTLMAIKMHDKSITLKLTWSTVTTSLVAVVFASVIGFSLTFLPSWQLPATSIVMSQRQLTSEQSLGEILEDDKRRLFGQIGAWVQPLPAEMEVFREAVRLLLQSQSVDDDIVQTSAQALATIGYDVVTTRENFLVLLDGTSNRGWGTYVINPLASPSLVEVPGPIHETGTLEAGIWLYLESDSRALAIGGARRTIDLDAPIELLTDSLSPYTAFHKLAARGGVIQVRGYRPSLKRQVFGDTNAAEQDIVWIKNSLPENLHLDVLKERVGPLEVRFKAPNETNRLRELTAGQFAELTLTQQSLRRMAASLANTRNTIASDTRSTVIDGTLNVWLNKNLNIARRGSELYRQPDLYQLLYLDEEILTPIFRTIATDYQQGTWTQSGIEALNTLNSRAGAFNYRLSRYRQASTNEELLVLHGEGEQQPYWGTFVFRAGLSEPFIIEVPRPGFERSSLDFGSYLFERTNAAAIFIGGAHPLANTNGSADISRASNRQNVFNLAQQVFLREVGDAAYTIIQARTMGTSQVRPPLESDLLFSSANGVLAPAEFDSGTKRVIEMVSQDGLSYSFMDGRAETAGLAASSNQQAAYLRSSRNKSFTIAWLSPGARTQFNDQGSDDSNFAIVQSLGIEVRTVSLETWLAERTIAGTSVSREQRELVRRFIQQRDVVALYALLADYQLEVLLERGRSYLAIKSGKTAVAIASLEPLNEEIVQISSDGLAGQLDRFRIQRAAWLELQ